MNNNQIDNLVKLLDWYTIQGGHHLNINIVDKDMLIDAMNNPNKYPNLVIRVSGYAVNFGKLTPDQKLEIINRTFHNTI